MRMLSVLNYTLAAAALAVCSSCGGGNVETVTGAVTIDGAPVDVGTISLRGVDASSPPAGGAINDGQFTITSREPLRPGTYTVMIQASQRTGKTVNDPQRGDVPEMRSIEIADSPQQIQLTPENAGNLALSFKSRSR